MCELFGETCDTSFSSLVESRAIESLFSEFFTCQFEIKEVLDQKLWGRLFMFFNFWRALRPMIYCIYL